MDFVIGYVGVIDDWLLEWLVFLVGIVEGPVVATLRILFCVDFVVVEHKLFGAGCSCL